MYVEPQLVKNMYGATVGFDRIAFAGSLGPTLENQTIAAFAAEDSHLGLLGIDPRLSNFSSAPPVPSFMQVLRSRSRIPSLSWGYTAGNQYRGNISGSLTLGGYDQSRFVEQHNGSWAMDAQNNLFAQLQDIYYETNVDSKGLLPTKPITALIDSALPYIWLPPEACLLFEYAFGLVWNKEKELYLINETHHTSLVQQDANITFKFGGMMDDSTSEVNITLPYAAFDLWASHPLVENATRYFPLKRANGPNQYVIGRAFFQEAFIIADYERKNFTIFPCKWENIDKRDISSIYSPTYNLSSSGEPEPTDSSRASKKSGGASKAGPIAGGVVAGVAVLIIAALIYIFWWKKRQAHYTTNGPIPEKRPSHPPDPHTNNAELSNTQSRANMSELQGTIGGPSSGTGVFELPAREEVAKEMRATIDAQELPTPETMSEVTNSGFPWRTSMTDRGNSPSPLSSPALHGRFSPMSSPSPELPSPIPSPSMITSSIPSPMPSPPPFAHPQPQRVVRPALNTVDTSISEL